MKFLGGSWTPETRAGTFARFFEAHAGLDRAAFLDRVRSPCLVIGAEPDPATWDQGIVVKIDRASGPSDEVVVGRSTSADVVLNCPTLSKRHVRLTRDAQGWSLCDLASGTGTTLEGTRIESNRPTRLEGKRARVGLGPDVTALFLVPDELHAFVEEAHARRAAGPQGQPPRDRGNAWPTWALLQEPAPGADTDHVLPLAQRPAVGAPEPRLEPRNKLRKPWRAQAREIAEDPRRLALVVFCVVVAVVAALVYAKPLAIMLVGERFPEWFNR